MKHKDFFMQLIRSCGFLVGCQRLTLDHSAANYNTTVLYQRITFIIYFRLCKYD